jgi:hypothetical protein
MVAYWWQCTNDQNGQYLSGKLANGDFFVAFLCFVINSTGLISAASRGYE